MVLLVLTPSACSLSILYLCCIVSNEVSNSNLAATWNPFQYPWLSCPNGHDETQGLTVQKTVGPSGPDIRKPWRPLQRWNLSNLCARARSSSVFSFYSLKCHTYINTCQQTARAVYKYVRSPFSPAKSFHYFPASHFCTSSGACTPMRNIIYVLFLGTATISLSIKQ